MAQEAEAVARLEAVLVASMERQAGQEEQAHWMVAEAGYHASLAREAREAREEAMTLALELHQAEQAEQAPTSKAARVLSSGDQEVLTLPASEVDAPRRQLEVRRLSREWRAMLAEDDRHDHELAEDSGRTLSWAREPTTNTPPSSISTGGCTTR